VTGDHDKTMVKQEVRNMRGQDRRIVSLRPVWAIQQDSALKNQNEVRNRALLGQAYLENSEFRLCFSRSSRRLRGVRSLTLLSIHDLRIWCTWHWWWSDSHQNAKSRAGNPGATNLGFCSQVWSWDRNK
jgi:hypothetical protein